MKVKFIAIAILGKNKRFALPGKSSWVHPEVHEDFLQKLKQKYVVISDQMIEELGGDILGAYPLVLSQNPNYKNPNALIFSKLEDVFYYAIDAELDHIFIMGGIETMQETMNYVSDFYWYETQANEGSDKPFPDISNFQWNKIAEKRNKDWSFHHLIKASEKLI